MPGLRAGKCAPDWEEHWDSLRQWVERLLYLVLHHPGITASGSCQHHGKQRWLGVPSLQQARKGRKGSWHLTSLGVYLLATERSSSTYLPAHDRSVFFSLLLGKFAWYKLAYTVLWEVLNFSCLCSSSSYLVRLPSSLRIMENILWNAALITLQEKSKSPTFTKTKATLPPFLPSCFDHAQVFQIIPCWNIKQN